MRFPVPTLYVCLLLAAAGAQRLTSGQRKSREITEDEVCRGKPHYVCQDEECVPVANARCDGVIECEDGSDEENCPRERNFPGEETPASEYTTTGASIDHSITTATATLSGCVLPEQPTYGSFELTPCGRPCNVTPGSRVPNSSFLTYRCNEGYALNENNTVTVCLNNVWYPPLACLKKVPGNYCPALKSKSTSVVCKYGNEIVPCEFEMPSGTKATLACKSQDVIPSFEDPEYTSEIFCLDNGTWDRSVIECTYECGTGVPDGTRFVLNGSEIEHGKFSWRVMIYKKDLNGGFWLQWWGTLISPDLVITRTYDLGFKPSASLYTVRTSYYYPHISYETAGAYLQKSSVQRIDTTEKRYVLGKRNPVYSLALLRLKSPFTMTALVRPICIDWGNTALEDAIQNRATVETGRTINRPYIPREECLSRLEQGPRAYLLTDMFCSNTWITDIWVKEHGYGFGYSSHGIWYLLGVQGTMATTVSSNFMDIFMGVGPYLDWISAAYNIAV